MFIRPKLFLTFLGLCLVPVVLLALVNYWGIVRIAESALQADQETRLADFTNQVTNIVNEDRNELIKLSRSTPLLDYIRLRNQDNSNSPLQSTGNSEMKGLVSGANPSSTTPVELSARLASVVNTRTHFSSISLFDQNRHPLFVAERRETEADEPMVFQTRDFLSHRPQPDDRIWTTRGTTLLCSPASTAAFGAYMACTVAIPPEKQEIGPPQGALVGELRLDPIFSEAAIGTGPSGAFASNSKRDRDMFIVLDRTGRILYHVNEALKHQSASESMPYFRPIANHMLSSEFGRQQRFTAPGGDEYSTIYAQIPTLAVSVAIASNHDQALADARDMGRLGLIVAVLLGAPAALLLTLYWQRKSRGIERVTEGVEAIAKGKLDHRIELLSSDDLRPLADNVGLMTKQLRDQIAREAETRQFQSFVRLSAILTHDLKNAIEALSLTVTNMERHSDNPEFRVDAMKTLRSATENLRALVARLSNPVTTLSGEHKRPTPVDLVPMLRRVISMTAEPASDAHQIEIKLPESLFALVDVQRMDKVAENLIINALEAMANKKGTLSIEAGQTDEGKPFFSVADTGEGMSRRFIEERLFHPFVTTKRRGVGLGLYTCREVVRANGGSIEVDSREGAGTTFRVVLPSAAIDERGNKQLHSHSHS